MRLSQRHGLTGLQTDDAALVNCYSLRYVTAQ